MPLLGALDIPAFRCGTRAELGAAVGRGPLAVVGILDGALAARAVTLLSEDSAPGQMVRPLQAQEDVR